MLYSVIPILLHVSEADGKVSLNWQRTALRQLNSCWYWNVSLHFFQNDRQSITGIYLFDGYFAKIDVIAKNKKYSARVRYLLQHLIDLRKNNWKPLVQEIHGGYEISMLKLSNVVHVQETKWLNSFVTSFDMIRMNTVIVFTKSKLIHYVTLSIEILA